MIKAIQIDVNGLCNAGCWYCPVAYLKNPLNYRTNMPLEMLEKILSQLKNGMNDFVDPSLNLIYTAHYNEVLLYPNFKEMLDLYRKYEFKINVLSNGIAMSKDKVEILHQNKDIINEVLLNIPSGNEDTWSRYTNLNKSLFKKVISNVQYASEIIPDKMFIMVNGINDKSLFLNGGWVTVMDGAPKLEDLDHEVNSLRKLFPSITVFPNHNLYDRAGHLESLNILTQAPAIKKYLRSDLNVIGCNGGLVVRDRLMDWMHIAPNGDIFMCCDDFNFETVYANINDMSLKDIWISSSRKDMIFKSRNELCNKCSAAIWG